jgi:hypothetical protein
MRNLIYGAIIGAIVATAALSGETPRQLDADEIAELLRRNTVVGTHDGRGFRHYFAENGQTSLRPSGGDERVGEWRVDEEADLLRLRWSDSETWRGVEVFKKGKVVIFEGPDGERRRGNVLSSRSIQ